MKAYNRIFAGIAALVLGSILPLGAATVTYNFGQVSDGTAPAGSPPWLQAVFTDSGLPANTVQLTLNAGNLQGSEFISCWYFNLNSAMLPSNLSFSPSGSNPSILTGANMFKAGQDGKFDILLGFSTVSGSQFGNGSSLTLNITGIGLTANDFNFLSEAGANGSYASAAHVQSIQPGDANGWINPTSTVLSPSDRQVPDGSETAALLGVSLLAIEGLRRAIRARSFARASV
jgi:hypothetical protein